MIIPLCPTCGLPADWDVHRVGHEVQLSVKCFQCNAQGPWEPELVEIIRKPRGRRPDQLPQPPD